MALTYFFVIIFLTFLKIVTGQKIYIVYPFGIKDLQGVECGYPGFNPTCNNFEKTVLKLPQSGEFLVRKIDYANKEIRLYDQNNCLAYAYQIYNFFNCPPSITCNISSLKGSPIHVSCLSTTTNTVLVVVSSSSDSNTSKAMVNGGCEIGAAVTIPIPFSSVTKISSYDFTTDDLYLTCVLAYKVSKVVVNEA
ncbi:hypothetical protein MKW98_017148, partial [Papaver atlanticum]